MRKDSSDIISRRISPGLSGDFTKSSHSLVKRKDMDSASSVMTNSDTISKKRKNDSESKKNDTIAKKKKLSFSKSSPKKFEACYKVFLLFLKKISAFVICLI